VGQEGEVAEVLADHLVLAPEEELVELVGTGPLGVEPHRAGLGLAELGAVGLEHQRRGQPPGLLAAYLSDQLDPPGDVPPLVAPSQLEPASERYAARRPG